MKENLSCEACEQELVAFLDGALTKAVGLVIERHVGSCSRCAATLADYRELAAGFRRLPLLAPPAGLEDRVMAAVVGRRRILTAGWQRFGAALGAVSFALTVGLLASLPKLARVAGLPDPFIWLVSIMNALFSSLASITKWVAKELALYDPIARQLWLAVQSLRSIPRVALVSLRTPEAQVAGAILITLGLALYLMLRRSRSHEGSVGHVCLSL